MKIDYSTVTVMVDPGRYVLGDPCYLIRGNHWDELLETCDMFDQPIGHVTLTMPGSDFLVGKRYEILAFGTYYGDGTYQDNVGNTYNVDSGLIGLVPVELAEALGTLKEGDVIIEFREPNGWCSNENGVMCFGFNKIDTRKYYEEDEEDDK
jgi:hypothetical protein